MLIASYDFSNIGNALRQTPGALIGPDLRRHHDDCRRDGVEADIGGRDSGGLRD